MLRRCGVLLSRILLVIVTTFLFCGCAELTSQEDFSERDPGRDEQLKGYQAERQVEIQKMMQQKMMRGNTQGSSKPGQQIGPPGGGGMP